MIAGISVVQYPRRQRTKAEITYSSTLGWINSVQDSVEIPCAIVDLIKQRKPKLDESDERTSSKDGNG